MSTEETDESPPSESPESQPEPTILYRNVCPTDLPAIYALEKASYPSDEAASKSQLQYRQHHAASFFRCAIRVETLTTEIEKGGDEELNMENHRDSLRGMGEIIGYVCATRCHQFTEESMKGHQPNGSLLAIHSVVVDERYRRQGTGLAMLREYIDTLRKMDAIQGIKKIVLICKMENVPFYIQSGFRVMGESKIEHGGDKWYDCEMDFDVRGNSEKKCQYWVIDSFAKVGCAGSGNPAAVVMIPNSKPGQLPSSSSSSLETSDSEILDASMFDPNDEENIQWMKTVACEFNLSETAFIWECQTQDPVPDDTVQYNIRFYTGNGTEVDLCGHATLASSSVLLELLGKEGKTDHMIVFVTKNDAVLKAKAARTSQQLSPTTRKIVMEFPNKKLNELGVDSVEYTEAISMIRDAFFPDHTIQNLKESMVCNIGLDSGGDDLLVELKFDAYSALPGSVKDMNITPLLIYSAYNRGIIVCSQVSDRAKAEGERADFYSRFFGPKVGIDEDPVTGSAHSVLGPYYADKLQRDSVIGLQTSPRGGIVECEVSDDLVKIKGIAVATMSGSLYI